MGGEKEMHSKLLLMSGKYLNHAKLTLKFCLILSSDIRLFYFMSSVLSLSKPLSCLPVLRQGSVYLYSIHRPLASRTLQPEGGCLSFYKHLKIHSLNGSILTNTGGLRSASWAVACTYSSESLGVPSAQWHKGTRLLSFPEALGCMVRLDRGIESVWVLKTVLLMLLWWLSRNRGWMARITRL